MGIHKGINGSAKIGASGAVAELNGWSVNESADTIETTSMLATSKTYTSGLSSWSGDMNCLWDETDTDGQGALTIGATVALTLYPDGSGAGATKLTGTAIITSVGLAGSMSGMIEQKFGFQGSGALTRSTV